MTAPGGVSGSSAADQFTYTAAASGPTVTGVSRGGDGSWVEKRFARPGKVCYKRCVTSNTITVRLRRLKAEIEKLPKVSGTGTRPDQVYVTNRLSRLLTVAEEQAKRLKDDYVSIEHLLLAALDRCTLKSLRYNARNSGVDIRSTSGSARALVTRPRSGGRYAVVEAKVDLNVELEPDLGEVELSDLLEFAERDCFIGSSLTAEPQYRWTVNGRAVGS